MKKILCIILSLFTVAALSLTASAGAFNPAGGCKTETSVMRADPSAVVKDGIIGDGEYREIKIDRDPDTTDLMLSFESATLYTSAEEFLNNVHFYLSWDEVHGLNVAGVATLLETPKNTSPQPVVGYYDGLDFPGDEFLFQFGMLFNVATDDDPNVMYRGFGYNTDTNTLLIGDYGVHGFTGHLEMTAYKDYIVTVNGNTVTYEMSFPLESVLPAKDINGNEPANGAVMLFDTTLTGGSVGVMHTDSAAYAVSIGDGGYLATWNEFPEPAHGKAIFTNDPVIEADDDTSGTSTPDISGGDGGTDVSDTSKGTSTDPEDVTTPDTSGGDGTTAHGTDIGPIEKGGEDTAGENKAPFTSDPITVAVVASVISACGFMIIKKEERL